MHYVGIRFAKVTMIFCQVALLGAVLALPAFGAAEIVEGREYLRLAQPQPTNSPDEIEVLEFFSYGCPACAAFHPTLTQWSSTLPEGVRLVRVPTSMGRPQWKPLVRAYYALQKINRLDQLDTALFEAIHRHKLELFSDESITTWVAARGVSAEEFSAALTSPEIAEQAARAEQMARMYGVDRTPMLGIDGKFVIRAKKRLDELTEVASQLIARLQKDRAP